MTEMEKYTSNFFSRKYGDDIYFLLKKLKEEVSELEVAINEMCKAKRESDYFKLEKPVRDEISDVQAVLTHLSAVMHTNFETCLIEALIKSKVREFNPEYAR